MAASPNPCGSALQRWCERHRLEPGRVAVAFSGGADSTALLLAAHARWPGRVVALHVNHGLQEAAEAFERHAAAACEARGIRLVVGRVDARPASGQSPEDAARQARYRALAEMAAQAGAHAVLLGQHADDQAETVLLALSRGAGVAGLSGMAERFERHGVAFGRPLLGLTGAELRQGLADGGVAFVDDPTNLDTRFTRNRMRSLLMPAWQTCFPGFRQALERSARHAAQAQALLEELAAADLAVVGAPPGVVALQQLSRARQGNALRHWLKREAGSAPSEAQLDELLDQIDACRTRGHAIRIKVGAGRIHAEAGSLHYVSAPHHADIIAGFFRPAP